MASLQYRGALAAANQDLTYQDYLTLLKSADLTTAAIDNAINGGLAGYATIAYVDAQDMLNATKAYIDAGDAQRIHLTAQNIANGVAPLDANGKVSPARINAPLTQRWVRGPWTPSAYLASQVDVSSGETTLYSCPVTDPGWPYKLVVFGMLDASTSLDAEYPIANVRAGDPAAGEIIAQGISMSDAPPTAAPVAGDNFTGTSTGLPPGDWNITEVEGTIANGGQYDKSGGEAVWTPSGGYATTLRYRRINAADAVTQTDYQKIRMVIGSTPDQGYVRLLGRLNTTETTWVGLKIDGTTGNGRFEYASGGSPVALGSAFNFDISAAGTIVDFLLGTSSSVRQFSAYRNNVLVSSVTDSGAVTTVSPGFRGWGFYAHSDVGGFIFTYVIAPPSLASLLIGDAAPSFGSMSIMPNSPATMATRTGPTTLYVRGTRSGTTSIASFSPYQPKLNIFAIPA